MNLIIIFGVLSVIVIVLQYGQHKLLAFLGIGDDSVNKNTSLPADFKKFQYTYLTIFYLMALADWLQGPYVFEAYKSLGYEDQMIGYLFLVGFASSMVFGTIIGGLSDKYGRRTMCLVYCACYIVTCTVQHIPSIPLLILGRVCGGIATSILFSAFESWMVCQHHVYNFDPSLISNTFYKQYLGNSIVAIIAGLLAGLGEAYTNSVLTAFKMAIVSLSVGAFLIYKKWDENYGDASINTRETFIQGFKALQSDTRVFLTGLAQCCYESAMYIFVFMWTPTLLQSDQFEGESFGFIFSCFMVAVMIGSTFFNIAKPLISSKKIMMVTFVIAIIGLCMPILTTNTMMLMVGFLLFEMTVGLFWPSISTLKAKYIPENVRSMVMNYFRLPTNVFVVGTLNFIHSLSISSTFIITCTLILISIGATYLLINTKAPTKPAGSNLVVMSDSSDEDDDDDDDIFDDMMGRPDDVVV